MDRANYSVIISIHKITYSLVPLNYKNLEKFHTFVTREHVVLNG